MSLMLIATERFAEHQTPPGHPESPERAEVMTALAREWRARSGEVIAPREATDEQLARVHSRDHLKRIASAEGRAVAFDPDTYTSPESVEIARLAAGAAVDAVERVMALESARAFALVRPPGHHAERNRAMGFCLYNNAAVAAAHARTVGAARVAIVDYDVHHGNGTEQIFISSPEVLYLSLHQYPYYPGTGPPDEIGSGEGRGFNVNVPLEVGAVDEDYRVAFASVVVPVVTQFAPDLIVVSAGFDAHERDPLAGMRLSTEAFGAMTADLCRVADQCCGGRLVALTEGGYDLRALGDSMRTVLGVLASEKISDSHWPEPTKIQATRGRAAVAAVKSALGSFWNLEE
jgi:acetoin utilization deacetylase AcuC-like enzyme